MAQVLRRRHRRRCPVLEKDVTPEQALQLLDNIAAACKSPALDRRDQAAAVQAVRVLHELIHPTPKAKKNGQRSQRKK